MNEGKRLAHREGADPTLILFKDGVEVGRLVGVQPKQAIIGMIRRAQ